MAYDFDWDGATLALGDEEAQTFVLPLEVTGNQQGIDSPGTLSALTDFINFGVFNGNFRLGPPDPSLDIDVASSTSGSNFLRGWRFVQSSNTAITAKQVRDTSSPSGSNLRFTFAAGASTDAAYIEQIIDIGGSRQRQVTDYIRAAATVVSGANIRVKVASQYLTTDGSIVGMPGEWESPGIPGLANWGGVKTAQTPPPGTARYLRLRMVAYRTSGSAAAVIDLHDVRRDRGAAFIVVDDDAGAYDPAYISMTDGIPTITEPRSDYVMPLGVQLIPLTFANASIPANATTQMLPTDAAIGTLGGSPRILIPWDADIVGVSYRMSAAPAAGTINFQVTVGGSNVWSPFGALDNTMALADTATQLPRVDQVSAETGIGMQMVTSAAYTPTTRNVVVTLWVLVYYQAV